MKISRRSFARGTLLAAAAAAVMPVSPADVAAATPNAEVEARIQWILAKYGAHLNDAERADIRRIITGGQAGIDTMRKYALDNATGPAERFHIYRRTAKP
jgi:hypothetical protein